VPNGRLVSVAAAIAIALREAGLIMSAYRRPALVRRLRLRRRSELS
jgi:hypothetical protein